MKREGFKKVEFQKWKEPENYFVQNPYEDEKTEAVQSSVICPRSHSWLLAK